MPAVRFHAIPVHDPDTGGPLLAARGAVGNIVDEVTRQPLRLSQDEAGSIPVLQPITITPGGYIPAHWNQDGLKRAVFVPLAGTWSTPVWSPEGLEEAAETAAAGAGVAADSAAAAAESARRLATAAGVGEVNDADTVVASYVGNRNTQTGRRLNETYVPATVIAGTGIDPAGITDSTAAIQAKFDGGGRIHFPPGNYVIDSISVTRSVEVTCDAGVTFTRKAGADTRQGDYWSPGAAMFEVDAPGLTVEFEGFTYDGNNTAQTTTEPTGFFLKTYPVATVASADTVVRIENARFTKGTSGYLCLRGDNNQRRYLTRVHLNRCTFEDTIYGKGRNDPSTPTPLGYAPTYVHVYDYVHLYTRDFRATWDKPTGTGQYAATALNATFYGQDHTTSGSAALYLHGTTYLRGVGRSGKAYNDDNLWNVGNGIGAIDCYGNADELFIEHLVAHRCENVSARSKGSVGRYTVMAATLVDCHRGLSVEPSSTGDAEAIVNIGQVTATGGSVPVIEVAGTTVTDRIPRVTVHSIHIGAGLTNPESYVTGGAAHFRNIGHLSVRGIEVMDAPYRAVTVTDVDSVDLAGVVVDGATQQGILVIGGSQVAVTDFDVRGTGGEGVMAQGNPATLTVARGRVREAFNYGVFSNNSTTHLTVEDVTVETITGASRGFYAGGGDAAFLRNRAGAGVTNPLVTHANAAVRQRDNSWNPTETWGFGAPTSTTVTNPRGSTVKLLNPVAGGHVGWVCTVEGAPGTWKTFGVVSA